MAPRPNRQIYRLFPKATSYCSIVRTVGKEARREVGARLPFNLHFNELAAHLYVPMRGDEASVWSTPAARLAYGGWCEAWGLTSISEDRPRVPALQGPAARCTRGRGVRRHPTGADFDALRAMPEKGRARSRAARWSQPRRTSRSRSCGTG